MVDFKAPHDAPQQPHLVQLGALLCEDEGHEVASIDLIVRPEGWIIPPEVSNIHGITTEMAKKVGVPLGIALSIFDHLMNLADTLVAHNIQFDRRVMRAAYSRIADTFTPPEEFCTMTASTPICRIPGPRGWKWPKLVEAHQHFFGEGFEKAHSAMADVRACKRVYYALPKVTV